jgi:hypothetical protein
MDWWAKDTSGGNSDKSILARLKEAHALLSAEPGGLQDMHGRGCVYGRTVMLRMELLIQLAERSGIR